MPVEVSNWTRMLPGVGAYNAIARIINAIKHQNPDGSPKIGYNLPVSANVPVSQVINPVTGQPYGNQPAGNMAVPRTGNMPITAIRTGGSFGGGTPVFQTHTHGSAFIPVGVGGYVPSAAFGLSNEIAAAGIPGGTGSMQGQKLV